MNIIYIDWYFATLKVNRKELGPGINCNRKNRVHDILSAKSSLFNKGFSNAFRKHKIGNPYHSCYHGPYKINGCLHVDRAGPEDDESHGNIIEADKGEIAG